jgi:hypothetical protein
MIKNILLRKCQKQVLMKFCGLIAVHVVLYEFECWILKKE